MRLIRGMVLLLVGALIGCAFSSEALGTTGYLQSKVVLEGPTGHGSANFVAFANHGEISLRIRGLSRERNPIYIAWILDEEGDARIGGAFPRTRAQAFLGSLIVPGPRKEGIGKVKRAKRLLITHVSRPRALQISARARRSNWRDPLQVRGELVAKGRAKPFR